MLHFSLAISKGYGYAFFIHMPAHLAHLRHRILDGIALSAGDLGIDGPNTGLHHIGIEGEWSGHWMGPFSLNHQMFEQMVQFSQAKSIDTVVDYEHATILSSDKAPAAGWITRGDLQIRKTDDGKSTLWAKIDWTDRAADHIRAKEYLYTSMVVNFNTRDRKSGFRLGASLHSLALTNTPFLHELPEVRLNSFRAALFGSFTGGDPMNEEQFKLLCKALGLTDSASVDDVMKAIEKSSALSLTGASMLEALSLGLDAPKDKAVGAILSLQDPKRSTEHVKTLEERILSLEGQITEGKALEAVKVAFADGKISGPESKEWQWALSYAKKDPDGFKEAMACREKKVPSTRVKPSPDGPPEALTDLQREVNQSLGLSEDDFKKYNKVAEDNLAAMR